MNEWIAANLPGTAQELGYHAERSYSGAQMGRFTLDWFTPSSAADAEIWSAIKTLRNRSRDLCRNNEYAKAGIRAVVNNVIGCGINFQSKIKQKKGQKFNEKANDEIEKMWRDWGKARRCHVAGILSWAQIERLCLKSLVESGEVLIRLVPQRFGDSKIKLGLEIIESDRLADDFSTLTHNKAGVQGQVRMGVEVDQWQRPLAYWLYPVHPGDPFGQNGHGSATPPVRVPADQIIHLYLCERPGQTRGIPWIEASMVTTHDLGEYKESERVKARAQANISGYIETPDPEAFGAEGSSAAPGTEMSLEPGTLYKLFPGEKFAGFDPSSPNPSLDAFIKDMLRQIASGLGVSYSSLSSDYADADYSSLRAQMLAERDVWRAVQAWLIESLHERVYEAWIDAAVAASKNAVFSNYDAESLCCPQFTARGFDWVDPEKDMQAAKGSILGGLSTVGRELAKQGIDYIELLQERDREIKLAQELGVTLDVYPETMAQPGMEGDPMAGGQPQPGHAPSQQDEGPFTLKEGMTATREQQRGIRGKKKCTAKPCGNTCIATKKVCHNGLSPEQKALAKKAKAAMKSGGAAVSSPLPEPKNPEPRGGAGFPENHSLGPESHRVSAQKLHAALESIKDEDNSENVARLQSFIQKSGVRAVIHRAGKQPTDQEEDDLARELGSDKVYKPIGEGYTNKTINHVVVTFRGAKNKEFSPDAEKVKQEISNSIGSDKAFSFSERLTTPSDRTFVTYVHEIGHQIHFRDYERSILDAVDKPKFLNKYADSLDTEWTAEAFTAWTVAPKAFKKHDPEGYAWIDRLVKDVVDDGIDNR